MMEDSTNTQKVKKFFDVYAHRFSSIYHERQEHFVKRILDRTLRKSMFLRFMRVSDIAEEMKVETVLDVGCGPGWHDVLLARSHPIHVVGVDISPSMIEIAHRQAKESALSGTCEFICTDFLEFVPEDEFELVFALGVVEYVENPSTIIGKMIDLATRKVIFSVPVKEHWLTPQRRLRYAIRNCPLWFYTEEMIRGLLETMGITQYTIELIDRDYLVYIDIA